MPSNWLAVDSNFPTFTGKEKIEEQIRSLQNYLFIMKEQLQYSLQNLTEDNWNTEALKVLSDDTTKKLTVQIDTLLSEIAALREQVGQVEGSVDLSGVEEKIKGLSKRVTALEDADFGGEISSLGNNVKSLGDRVQKVEDADFAEKITALGNRVKALEDLDKQMQYDDLAKRIEAIESMLKEGTDQELTLGQVGYRLNLVGDVYLNGELLTTGDRGDIGEDGAENEENGGGENEATEYAIR